MSVTLDNLAKELMNWFDTQPTDLCVGWPDEADLIDEFAYYLNENSKIKAIGNAAVSDSTNRNHLVLYKNEHNVIDGVIARFIIDRNKNSYELDALVKDTSIKMQSENLKTNYHSTTKCIVSVYNDLHNRSKFHEYEFIEIYQRFGMGCAIKRL